MKTIIINLFIIFSASLLYSQSSIVYDMGTNIDVGTGADVCAGTINVNGTYSGSGTFCNAPVAVENEVDLETPKEFSLSQNYPNPFNPSTKISFALPKQEFVTLKVFDVLGNVVTTLLEEYKLAGSYDVDFDASKLSSGVYFYILQSGSFVATNKMILLR